MNERLDRLREVMARRHMDAYLVLTSDFHESEYVGEYFKCREYLTGFTGSAGTAVVTRKDAGLWTDGRYFVQAERQLEESGFTLKRMGQEGTISVEDYLEREIPEGGVLGVDGRTLNSRMGRKLEEILEPKQVTIAYEEDLIGQIWEERPTLPMKPIWILEEKYAGKSAQDKIDDLREEMGKVQADIHILTTLDDIGWLLNIRGGDIDCNPVALSYVVVTRKELYLFVNEAALSQKVNCYFEEIGVSVKPYDELFNMVKSFRHKRILLETGKVSYTIVRSLGDSNRIIDRMNPVSAAKSVKNQAEVENERRAHIKDGVAVTKFICWLKKQVGKIPMTEICVSKHLEKLRREQEGYLEPSFHTISAYGEHAAMCHYLATPETDMAIEGRGLYLVDSGGHYYEGTTDITRTVVMGPITDEERQHFTLTVMSMLRLSHVKFLYGCCGVSLDYAARQLFWSRGMNYNHGTGHGVGYLLNVHERPNGIRYEIAPERMDYGVLEEGMVCSNEPGIYVEGSHGIRTENMMVCKKAEKNQYGQFMEFECLTFVPIDLDGLDFQMMEEKDIQYLNEYHRQVWEKISPYLTEEETVWLKEATREVSRKEPIEGN